MTRVLLSMFGMPFIAFGEKDMRNITHEGNSTTLGPTLLGLRIYAIQQLSFWERLEAYIRIGVVILAFEASASVPIAGLTASTTCFGPGMREHGV